MKEKLNRKTASTTKTTFLIQSTKGKNNTHQKPLQGKLSAIFALKMTLGLVTVCSTFEYQKVRVLDMSMWYFPRSLADQCDVQTEQATFEFDPCTTLYHHAVFSSMP